MLRKRRQDPSPAAALQAEALRSGSEPTSRRPPLRWASRICDADVCGGYTKAAVADASMDRRTEVIAGLFVGDALAASADGLPPHQAAQLCRERVPWPFSAQGGGPLGLPPGAASADCAVTLAALAGLADERDHDGTADRDGEMCLAVELASRRIGQLYISELHPSGTDVASMTALGRLTTSTENLGVLAGPSEAARRPQQTSSAALGRAALAAAVWEPKLGAVDAAVSLTLITHAGPEEVVCGAVLCICTYSLLHDEPLGLLSEDDYGLSQWARHLLLAPPPAVAGARGASAWSQWKAECAQPHCRRWLDDVPAAELTRAEERVADALAGLPTYEPYSIHVRGDSCLRSLLTALWAVRAGAAQKGFPQRMLRWLRYESCDPPESYRERLTKERRLAAAGLALPPKKDHPAGDLWNPLDASGGFDAVMWAALAGGAVAGATAAGAMLAAKCGVPQRWLVESAAFPAAQKLLRRAVGDGEVRSDPPWLHGVAEVQRCHGTHLLRRIQASESFLEQPESVIARASLTGFRPEEQAAHAAAWVAFKLPTELRDSLREVDIHAFRHADDDEPAPPAAPPPLITVSAQCPYSEALSGRGPVAIVLPHQTLTVVLGETPAGTRGVVARCWGRLLRCTTVGVALWQRRAAADAVFAPAWLSAKRSPCATRLHPPAPPAVAIIPSCAVLWDDGGDGSRWGPLGSGQRLVTVVCGRAKEPSTRKRHPGALEDSDEERRLNCIALLDFCRSSLSAAASRGHRRVVLADVSAGMLAASSEQAAQSLLKALLDFPGAFDSITWCVPDEAAADAARRTLAESETAAP